MSLKPETFETQVRGEGGTTARLALASATARLEASPGLLPDAARDALTLLLYTLGITRAQFHADPGRTISAEEQAAYEVAIARRLAHEPIQYIIGEQEFFGLALRVTPAVLIPRPETEHLVEAVLTELSANQNDAVIPSEGAQRRSRGIPAFAFDIPTERPLRILDIGTGSGAIAIALALHLPNAHVVATDISAAALRIAEENAARHSLAARIQFVESDLLASVSGKFDAIVSNPPYVPEADRATLHPQVRDYEPATALFAGDDGLAIYRRLIPHAREALMPGGLLALEIGHGQRDALAQLLAGWNAVHFVDDLQGIPRIALARNADR